MSDKRTAFKGDGMGYVKARLIGALIGCVLLAGLFFCSHPAKAQEYVGGYDSGSRPVQTCTGAATIASGNAVCGLFSIPIARTPGGSGEIENLYWISNGGSTVALMVRLWDKFPSNTTCTGGSAYVGSFTDDQHLITPPFGITGAAPTVTTGDAKTYASVTFVPPISYANQDLVNNLPTTFVYACVVATATDAPDQSALMAINLTGPKN